MQALVLIAAVAAVAYGQMDPNRAVVIHVPPSPAGKGGFDSPPPRAVPVPQNQATAPPPVPGPRQIQPSLEQAQQPNGILPPTPNIPGAQQPQFQAQPPGTQNFVPRNQPAVVAAPPVTIPPDVQNQLIKFFGLDSFGIPGLTGNHPNGFAGAVQEMRAAGIPVQGLPPMQQPKGVGAANENILSQANPAFGDNLSQLKKEADNPGPYRGAASIPLPADVPGENGLIGLLSNSIRKIVKDTGLSDALSNSLPSVLGGSQHSAAASSGAKASGVPTISASQDDTPTITTSRDIRRKPSSPTQGVLSGLAAALGGGGSRSPTHAGLPRIPGIPLLPGGIPRNAQGQIDVVKLIGSVTRRISNGTTLADVLPPEQLQTLADNVTDALLPDTPQGFDLSKFMGRWFEGINSPRATEQRCVVHHYGGLTKNEKTATFTALKIYREGSEFGPVKYSIGYAFRGGNKDAMLTLHSSEASDTQPFWIYKLGPEGKDPFGNSQYEYAIVSNWVKYPVTVLVRDPDTFKAKYQKEVLIWLEKEGFVNGFIRAFNMLQPASYNSCQYADSTFEVFGRK